VREIPGKAKTVQERLEGVRYSSLLYPQIAERIWNPADLLRGGTV
jgi:hypothetical protein